MFEPTLTQVDLFISLAQPLIIEEWIVTRALFHGLPRAFPVIKRRKIVVAAARKRLHVPFLLSVIQ